MKLLTAAQRESLRGLAAACRAAQTALAAGDRTAVSAARRLSRELADLATAADLPELHAAATAVERASGPLLSPTLALLLSRATLQLRQHPDRELVVLIVDDDPLISAVLTPLLSAPGRRLLTAATAAAARAILAETPVALIILDLVLPDQDGRTLLVTLREDLTTAGIPVIILSGNTAAGDALECFALGADAVQRKPFDPALLAAEVTARLQRSLRLTDSARVDALTRLPNRAAFLEAFTLMLTHSERSQVPLAVGLFDIDRFKNVNDTYGHATGDIVLRRVAELVAHTLRKSDFVARWGGEEFTVFFPDTDWLHAEQGLLKALAAVRAEQFRAADGRTFSVSFSAGIADARAHDQPLAAIAAADRLLYQAKAAGRNRVVTPVTEVPAQPAARQVLTADDDPLITAVISRVLQADGLAVHSVADGAAVLAAAGTTAYALYIIDLRMPGLDGFQVLQQLRAQPATATTPVIILTGTGNEQDIVRCFELGANDYVVKPFSPVELAARVRRLLR
ncbi:MAG TPA: response regulator [bacterium]|nr:response regulator [bacterium]